MKDTSHPYLEAKILSDAYVIQIVDNGPGIPKDLQSRIFESGFTTKPDGQGKGLAFCTLIMTSIGGSISVNSDPGYTEFSLHFPHPTWRPQHVSGIQS